MKLKSLASVIAAMAIAIGATAAYAEPSHKQKPIFFCGKKHGVSTTFARTRMGDVPIIRWVTTTFNSSGWPPQKRCELVSRRFQKVYENGTLRFITTGTINKQPVVCGTNYIGGSCSITGLLFTLRPTDDPNRVMEQLFEFRDFGNPLRHSSSNEIFYDDDGDIYIYFEDFILRRAVDLPTREATPYESDRLW